MTLTVQGLRRANHLRGLRDHAGWTQAQAADAFGMSLRGYQKIETGLRGLSQDRIAQACRLYGVSPSRVLITPSHDALHQPHETGDEPVARGHGQRRSECPPPPAPTGEGSTILRHARAE